ncbi:MAG: trypco2 family protein [Candidatus Paceibacterota bacterium]
MELKDFVKKVIIDLDQAVSEANKETGRDVRFKGVKEQRTALEFDVAVTVESTNSGKGGGEIKVWGIGQLGATGSAELKNSTVSRVSFGVDINEYTKAERAVQDQQFKSQFRSNPNIGM